MDKKQSDAEEALPRFLKKSTFLNLSLTWKDKVWSLEIRDNLLRKKKIKSHKMGLAPLYSIFKYIELHFSPNRESAISVMDN